MTKIILEYKIKIFKENTILIVKNMNKNEIKEKSQSSFKTRKIQTNQNSLIKINQESKSIHLQEKSDASQLTDISSNHSTQQTSLLLEKSQIFCLNEYPKYELNKQKFFYNKKLENKNKTTTSNFIEEEFEKKNANVNEKNNTERINNLSFDPLTLLLYPSLINKKRKTPFRVFKDIGSFVENIKNNVKNETEKDALNKDIKEKNYNNESNSNSIKNMINGKNNSLNYKIMKENNDIIKKEKNKITNADSLHIEYKINNHTEEDNNQRKNKNIFDTTKKFSNETKEKLNISKIEQSEIASNISTDINSQNYKTKETKIFCK